MPKTRSVHAYAPGSVSNMACGFDIFGFAIEHPGDEVEATERPESGVELAAVHGDDDRLPREAERNTAGVAVAALLEAVGERRGVSLVLRKNMPLSSGLGSSAASGVAAVVAVDHLLGLETPREVLLRCAMEGERLACGTAHPDNAAPCLYGGFLLLRGEGPDVVSLPVPGGLSCAVVRPHVEVETRKARQLLGDSVPLRSAVRHWGNTAAVVAALYSGDLALLARSMEDVIAEPVRAPLVPGYTEAKAAALEAGALGSNLSGSGPSTFALCADRTTAEAAADAMVSAFKAQGHDSDRLVSAVGAEGARIVSDQLVEDTTD